MKSTKENSLIIKNPQLAAEWHPTKNGSLTPADIAYGSTNKVWWICDKGHEWQASCNARSRGTGCPICSNRIVLEGYNDLAAINPSLAAEWDFTKNNGLLPTQVLSGSNNEVWWICKKCGRNWKAKIVSRNRGNGCTCDCYERQKTVMQRNRLNVLGSLVENNPDLVREWHPTKNGNLTPAQFTIGSRQKVWWICDKGHEWQASINSRKKRRGCPKCSAEKSSSFPEQAIYFYFNKYFPCESRAIIHGKEADIFIPSLNIAIEYDGAFYHKGKESDEREQRKNKHFSKYKIKLYRVKESDADKIDVNNGIIYCAIKYDYLFLERAIKILSSWILGKEIEVDIRRDTSTILAQYIELEKQNSLAVKCPEAVLFWNTERNDKLTPEQVPFGSQKKVWWKCNNEHEWQNSVYSFYLGRRCPYCVGTKLLQGFNDLATKNPQLASEWNYIKNKLKPSEVLFCYGKSVWWICDKGHEWQTTVKERRRGKGCPYCSGNKVFQGFNDLATKNPKLASEWNYEKNGLLKPTKITSGSKQKAWWICDKGHEWQAIVNSRTRGNGCPYCSNKINSIEAKKIGRNK